MNMKEFCDKCRHKDTKANQHPCDSCMEMGINENANAPLGFEPEAKKHKNLVVVVRCGECVHSDKADYDYSICCDFLPKIMKPDDFCSYGERKEDE